MMRHLNYICPAVFWIVLEIIYFQMLGIAQKFFDPFCLDIFNRSWIVLIETHVVKHVFKFPEKSILILN